MARPGIALERATLGLLTVNVITVAVIVVGVMSARRVSEQSEKGFVALVDDVTRASQAQASAERMIAVGRGYLLTREPELLARAQAADVKLTRTIRTLASTAEAAEERQLIGPLLNAAERYRDVFGSLLSGETAPRQPQEVADALRTQLIPARDDLLARLDRLAARRLRRLELLLSSAREMRNATFEPMLLLGVLGVVAAMVLVRVVVMHESHLSARSTDSKDSRSRALNDARWAGAELPSHEAASARQRP